MTDRVPMTSLNLKLETYITRYRDVHWSEAYFEGTKSGLLDIPLRVSCLKLSEVQRTTVLLTSLNPVAWSDSEALSYISHRQAQYSFSASLKSKDKNSLLAIEGGPEREVYWMDIICNGHWHSAPDESRKAGCAADV